MPFVERLAKSVFSRMGLQVQRAPRRLWDHDAFFVALWRECRDRTLLDVVRFHLLYQLARMTQDVPGQAAEVGVYRGGAARLLSKVFEPGGKTVHLFDTFQGLPDADPARDRHRAGEFADTSQAAVRAFLADRPNVALHAGLFPATAGAVAAETFAFVHADVDLYLSTKDCCEFFYPRLSPGGVLLCDDYGAPTCPGVAQAVDEFLAGKPARLLVLPTGQCAVLKR